MAALVSTRRRTSICEPKAWAIKSVKPYKTLKIRPFEFVGLFKYLINLYHNYIKFDINLIFTVNFQKKVNMDGRTVSVDFLTCVFYFSNNLNTQLWYLILVSCVTHFLSKNLRIKYVTKLILRFVLYGWESRSSVVRDVDWSYLRREYWEAYLCLSWRGEKEVGRNT
jgi:hypothetical protein